MPVVELLEVEALAERIRGRPTEGAVVDPIPRAQTQEGPNCGFYALSIVLDYWKAKGRTATSYPARKRDVDLQGRDGEEKAHPSLRAIGKQVGALDLGTQPQASTGGILTAAQLAAVAQAVKFQAAVVTRSDPTAFIEEICRSVTAGVPVIVAFDADGDNDPIRDDGQHSHWGVVFG